MTEAPTYIRTASQRDIPAIRHLLVETWHATYDGIIGPDAVTRIAKVWFDPAVLERRLSVPASEFIVADDGKSIHAVAYAVQKDKTVKLHQLYVRPDSQGRGIGTRMMQELFFCFDSADRMELNVHAANAGAIGFYKAGGFEEAGEAELEGPDGLSLLHKVLSRKLDQ